MYLDGAGPQIRVGVQPFEQPLPSAQAGLILCWRLATRSDFLVQVLFGVDVPGVCRCLDRQRSFGIVREAVVREPRGRDWLPNPRSRDGHFLRAIRDHVRLRFNDQPK